MDKRQTVVFDFDGVIHSYRSGWQGPGNIPDPAVPGIKEAIAELREIGYKVIVVSTRCAEPAGKDAVEEYLLDRGITVDGVTAEKPPAVCYIDDRAICFDGHPEKLIEQVMSFSPWHKKCADSDAKARRLSDLAMNGDTVAAKTLLRTAELECGAITAIEEEQSALNRQLRPCKALVWENRLPREVIGRFHCWGSDYEEFEAGPGNHTTAVIEQENGEIVVCAPETVQFLDSESKLHIRKQVSDRME